MDIKHYIEQLEQKHNIVVVYLTKSGSTLYGTNGPDSAIDYKGIFIPSKRDVLFKRDIPYLSFTTGSKNNTVDNINYKSLSHAVRVIHEIAELLEIGTITFPLRYANELKNINAGKIPLEVYTDQIEQLVVA